MSSTQVTSKHKRGKVKKHKNEKEKQLGTVGKQRTTLKGD